ncbi:valine--tRNA ligase [Neoehrlichia mikurensis]|uniref:Valine--tRNA ligase n=1 Tax=Neoehrlichia mikurensis TaxID=89586 RepID=A0A9Q9BW60_9RICK|nr:valine--tRNA ligase [Neoehrlichia mikurensis]QXK92257.1 valine--tRNA ligase [Neoehrlichia mikurensis]QXK92711.1 valine--tRNA ligase [Neoehrlichia mikurensis]QXK93949.1 valine--tRNA ligase [Neoehrlichia mikurensis]UTO55886.1 valine--tRNA ligase [Neoehrlichia mikurensis]UTO56802.1 valine--tRNA ligase [Neoehrlichia mikurensis]
MELSNKYSFKIIEDKINTLWENTQLYKWTNSNNNNFVIDTPPPTISGQLHMGHVFSYCHTDFIARYQRMLGKNVFYPIGFDDNGLPTERLVEKTKKIKAKDLERKDFAKMCQQVSCDFRMQFKKLFRILGISYDWTLEYHTMSKDIQALSQMSFIDLYKKNKLYRKLQPIFWDTVDQTAIAQVEIEDKEVTSFMNIINFRTENGEIINIATTRPELIPACVAIFFHPEDHRYVHLNGQYAIVPIFENKVKILPDDKVKIEKGTGLVMCCTFGDEMDIYWWNTHQLDTKIIINKAGKICNIHSSIEKAHAFIQQINNLSIIDARKITIEFLSQHNLLIAQQPIIHNVKCAERSGAPIEILLDYQWFIKILDYKNEILQKIQQINWYPQCMSKRMKIWIDSLNWDWCISRQRYFGVPFPIWYSKRTNEQDKVIIPDIKDLPVNPTIDIPHGYSKEEVEAETDVMDTWATSSLSPQFHIQHTNKDTLLNINNLPSFLFPADLRAQSHEIIRSWAFYTILKSNYHNNDIPWKNIMISGWCLSEDKTKMSKSKGNTIDPYKILDAYGADAVRYWAANSKLGTDTAFSHNTIKTGQRLITKLWNASKFVSMFTSYHHTPNINYVTEPMDKWILSKLYKTISYTTQQFNCFEYCIALNTVEEFFWKDFCNNYLELAKKRAYGKDVTSQENLSAINTLSYTLKILLKLLAPFIPYITEEIYNTLYSNNSIHSQNNWPIKEENLYDKSHEQLGDKFIEILDQVRKLKSNMKVSIKSQIDTLTINCQNSFYFPQSFTQDLKYVCNANNVFYNDIQEDILNISATFV